MQSQYCLFSMKVSEFTVACILELDLDLLSSSTFWKRRKIHFSHFPIKELFPKMCKRHVEVVIDGIILHKENA